MVGIELAGFPLEARMGHQVTLAARERGAIIRPLGDVVVLMPPLAMSEDELRGWSRSRPRRSPSPRVQGFPAPVFKPPLRNAETWVCPSPVS